MMILVQIVWFLKDVVPPLVSVKNRFETKRKINILNEPQDYIETYYNGAQCIFHTPRKWQSRSCACPGPGADGVAGPSA